MFTVVPDAGATILTDTLVTDQVGVASQFTAKCRVIPQMRMAMAGTGSGNLLNTWYQRLNEGLLAVDIDMCARHASVPLSELWEEICSQHGLIPIAGAIDANETAATLAGRTATIYHFGQDGDGRFVWFAFRSTTGFKPERFDQGGFGVKPHPFDGVGEAPSTLDEMVRLGVQIRNEQDSLPLEERIHIGGELWITNLGPNTFLQTPVHRFDDWPDHWNAMNEYHQTK